MAHFAELDPDNIVTRIIVVSNSDCLDENGQESEDVGVAFCVALFGGRWLQTSYNANIRGKYAAIGGAYDPQSDEFMPDVDPYPLSDEFESDI